MKVKKIEDFKNGAADNPAVKNSDGCDACNNPTDIHDASRGIGAFDTEERSVREESGCPVYRVGDRVLIRNGECYKTSLHRETAYGGKTVVVERPTVYSVKDVIVYPVPGESVCVLEYSGPDNCLFPVLRERMEERYLERGESL